MRARMYARPDTFMRRERGAAERACSGRTLADIQSSGVPSGRALVGCPPTGAKAATLRPMPRLALVDIQSTGVPRGIRQTRHRRKQADQAVQAATAITRTIVAPRTRRARALVDISTTGVPADRAQGCDDQQMRGSRRRKAAVRSMPVVVEKPTLG